MRQLYRMCIARLVRRAAPVVILAMLCAVAQAVTPSPSEMATARAWATERFREAGAPFFSFNYGPDTAKLTAPEILKRSTAKLTTRALDEGITERTVTWTDRVTGLQVRCVGLEYPDFPAVEWVLYFRNTGAHDTPILDTIQALDCAFPTVPGKGARLIHANGSFVRYNDFAPQVTSLGNNLRDPAGYWFSGDSNPIEIGPNSGRSSAEALPFFNVDMADHGVIEAVGWTGEWAASFGWKDNALRLKAGMKRTHLRLMPGEEIRSPRILLLFWDGDWMHGQNLLRRFILAHHSPRVNGRPARVPLCYNTWGEFPCDAYIAQMKWIKEQGLPFEDLWVDAGWYGNAPPLNPVDTSKSQWAVQVGNWYPNRGYFPHGLAPLGEALEKMGFGFVLWNEPERVHLGTAWANEHRDYLLGTGNDLLLNLGNEKARQMVLDHLTRFIREAHITCYRQDFNMDPRSKWAWGDPPDRVGMTEIKHVTGLYALWDALLARFPGLLIDNCAGGGQRIDLETVSRSIPLWRSDAQTIGGYSTTINQTQTQGLGLWLPLSPGFCDREDDYTFRSTLGPGMILVMGEFQSDLSKHFSLPWLRRNLGQFEEVRDLFLGDFYPLLDYSLSEDAWAAWQYDRPEKSDGMVLAFRRAESPFAAMTATLHALQPDARYEVRSLDNDERKQYSGRELMESGLPIAVTSKPGSALFVYHRL